MRLIHVLFACMLISFFASPTRGAENSTTKPPLIKGSSGSFENLIEVPAKQASKEMQFNAGAYWLWAGATQAGTEGDTWQWRKFGPYSLEPGKIYVIKFADNVTAEAQPTEEEEEDQEKSQHVVVSFENPQTAPYGFVLEPMTDANKPTSTAPIKQPSIRDKIPGVWEWFINGDVSFYPNGTLVQGDGHITGTWTAGQRYIKIKWSHGYFNTLTLQGNVMRGYGGTDPNASYIAPGSGHEVSGKKLRDLPGTVRVEEPAPASGTTAAKTKGNAKAATSSNPIVGRWQWFINGDVDFLPNGTLVQGPSITGTWVYEKGFLRIRWSNGWYNTMRLSRDGLELRGYGGRDPQGNYENSGADVSGKKITYR